MLNRFLNSYHPANCLFQGLIDSIQNIDHFYENIFVRMTTEGLEGILTQFIDMVIKFDNKHPYFLFDLEMILISDLWEEANCYRNLVCEDSTIELWPLLCIEIIAQGFDFSICHCILDVSLDFLLTCWTRFLNSQFSTQIEWDATRDGPSC